MQAFKGKQFFALCAACLLALIATLSMRLACVCRLRDIDGQRTFYVYAPSSKACVRTSLSIGEIFFVTGECVEQEFSSVTVAKAYAKTIVERYRAVVLFEEEIDGIKCLYAYAEGFGNGVTVYGKRVNLHIAVKNNRCAVGTPMIFGGY
jgi:hypothetical protein